MPRPNSAGKSTRLRNTGARNPRPTRRCSGPPALARGEDGNVTIVSVARAFLSLPLVGRVGHSEAEGGVGRLRMRSGGGPHPTGLRPATLPTKTGRGEDPRYFAALRLGPLPRKRGDLPCRHCERSEAIHGSASPDRRWIASSLHSSQ